MAVSTDPNDPNFGLETDATNPNFGLPSQPAPSPAPTPAVQSSQTLPSQSREATRPIISLPNLTASIFGETAGRTVQNAQEAGMDVVRGIPGMIESLPGMAYQGLKFAAGGPQEKAQVIEQAASEALPQGRQVAQDVESPLGSRESFRGLASLGMLAAPMLTDAIFGRVQPEIPVEAEKPPVQPEASSVPETTEAPTTPTLPETPVEAAAKEVAPQAPKPVGEVPSLLGTPRNEYVEPKGYPEAVDAYKNLQPDRRISFTEHQRLDAALRSELGLSPEQVAQQVHDFFQNHARARDVVAKAIESGDIEPGQQAQDLYDKTLQETQSVSSRGQPPSALGQPKEAEVEQVADTGARPVSVFKDPPFAEKEPTQGETVYRLSSEPLYSAGQGKRGAPTIEIGNLHQNERGDWVVTDPVNGGKVRTPLFDRGGKNIWWRAGDESAPKPSRETLKEFDDRVKYLKSQGGDAALAVKEIYGEPRLVWAHTELENEKIDYGRRTEAERQNKSTHGVTRAGEIPKNAQGNTGRGLTESAVSGQGVLEGAVDTGAKPSVPVSTQREPSTAQGNTKEVTPTAETPTTRSEVTPEGQAAPQSITSIKNEQVDTERAARGLPPVIEPARKAFGESWEQATQKINDNPSYPDQLIDELKSKPRALSDVEDATLLHRQVDLQNQYQKSADLLIKARESGDEVGAMEHDARVNALSDQLLELYDVGKKSGTETGRGLAARKLLAAEDFSLANMITQKRAANQGAALTPEQTSDVNKASSRISAAKIAYDAYETSPKAEAYRNRLKTLTEQYKERTAKGDFASRQRTKILLDKDGEQLKSNLERAKKDWLTALQKDRAANRTPSQKFWDRFVGVERAMKLSSDVVLAKLTTAAAVREAGLTPLEEAAGAGIGKVLPRLVKRAPREGGFSVAAEIKAKAEMFTSGMKDAWRNLKMQHSDLDTLYSSKKPPPPSEFYDYLGYLHGALKAPVKRAEFARSLTKRMEWAVKNGQDLNNVNTMRALSDQAYVDANRSIFMQDNVVASSFANALRMAEKSKVAPNLGPAIARIGRFLVPIVKIPTNIVGEVATGVHGTAVGGARAAVAYLKGIDKLPPEQADSIMRQLKKGAIGNSLILAGYYGAHNIGGFYHDKDKREDSDVQPGRYRVGNVDLPASAGHSTGAMLLNIGATVKRVQDERVRKTDSQTKGLAEGVRAAGAGLAHEMPFIPAATGITDALGSQYGLEKYVNGMIQSTIVPALSSHIAKILDTPGSLPSNLLDEPVKRRPTNPLEGVKMGIPGLRQTVPERPERGTKPHKEKKVTGEDRTPLNP